MIEKKNDLSNKILSFKKPLIILGETFFKTKSAEYLFLFFKRFFIKK